MTTATLVRHRGLIGAALGVGAALLANSTGLVTTSVTWRRSR